MVEPWKLLSEEEIVVGHRKLLRRRFELPYGRIEEYEVQHVGQVVCVLALTPEDNVILVRQFRPGPNRILRELPGGGVLKGELPEDAAVRELSEETGYAGEMRFIGEILDDAYSTIGRHCFVATNCIKVREAHPDENEFLEVEEMPLMAFREFIKEGQFTDIEVAYLGLDNLGRL